MTKQKMILDGIVGTNEYFLLDADEAKEARERLAEEYTEGTRQQITGTFYPVTTKYRTGWFESDNGDWVPVVNGQMAGTWQEETPQDVLFLQSA